MAACPSRERRSRSQRRGLYAACRPATPRRVRAARSRPDFSGSAKGPQAGEGRRPFSYRRRGYFACNGVSRLTGFPYLPSRKRRIPAVAVAAVRHQIGKPDSVNFAEINLVQYGPFGLHRRSVELHPVHVRQKNLKFLVIDQFRMGMIAHQGEFRRPASPPDELRETRRSSATSESSPCR